MPLSRLLPSQKRWRMVKRLTFFPAPATSADGPTRRFWAAESHSFVDLQAPSVPDSALAMIAAPTPDIGPTTRRKPPVAAAPRYL